MLVSKHEYDREWRRAESWKATAREMQARLKNAQAVCRYLRGEVKKMTDDVAWLPHYQEATARWQVESKRWENECHDLRGEVERLEAEVEGWRDFNAPLIRAWDNDEDDAYNLLDNEAPPERYCGIDDHIPYVILHEDGGWYCPTCRLHFERIANG